MTQKHPLACDLYLVKNNKRGRQLFHRPAAARVHAVVAAWPQNERRQREPWVLVSSLGARAAKQVMRCYQLRMQIEESLTTAVI